MAKGAETEGVASRQAGKQAGETSEPDIICKYSRKHHNNDMLVKLTDIAMLIESARAVR